MSAPATDPPPSWARHRRTMVAAVVIMLAAAAVIAVVRIPSTSTASVQETSPPPTATRTAKQSLLHLADTISGDAGDSATGYAYHHLRRWILDTTGTPVPRGVRENAPAVVAVEIRRWAADDGSRRGVDVEIGPDYTLAGAHPEHRSSDEEFADGRTTLREFTAGAVRSSIPQPLATDPAGLARQLATVYPQAEGPHLTLLAVEELHTSLYVDLPVRRTVLQTLAEVEGIGYHAQVTDRLGRTGVAVSLTAGGVDYTLVFDPTSGRLLASHQRSAGAHEYLDVPHGLIRYYTLFIEQSRRPGLDPGMVMAATVRTGTEAIPHRCPPGSRPGRRAARAAAPRRNLHVPARRPRWCAATPVPGGRAAAHHPFTMQFPDMPPTQPSPQPHRKRS